MDTIIGQYSLNKLGSYICNYNLNCNCYIDGLQLNSKVKDIKIQIFEKIFQFLQNQPNFIFEIKDLIKCCKFYFNNRIISNEDTIKDVVYSYMSYSSSTNVIVIVDPEIKIHRVHIPQINNYYIYVPGNKTVNYIIEKLKQRNYIEITLFDKDNNKIDPSKMIRSFNNLEIELKIHT